MFSGYGNYDRSPEIALSGFERAAFGGYGDIAEEIGRRMAEDNINTLVLDLYPGTDEDEILRGLEPLGFSGVFRVEDCMVSRCDYLKMIEENLTDDRVFGVMTDKALEDYFIPEKIAAMQKEIEATPGRVLVIGVGASLITGGLLVYADLARWEIQTRFKAGLANYHTDNPDAPFLSKYKQGFFVEWRLADRHKRQLFDKIDYLLDTNRKNSPVMITGAAFLAGLERASSQPFRLVPYCDPGVWGGQWMKSVCGLPKEAENYAWIFDGVPEENSLYLRVGQLRAEIPAIDLVFYRSKALLGERVYDIFGAEFPIRFDMLDTMGGGNLSLQVHPIKEYITEKFGMKYTQDESYYILDCEEGAGIYLGLKDNVQPSEMISDLETAKLGGAPFDADKYINRLPAKKHDHFLIPAGTVHCSGAGSLVLEISATPYIFTFKLWDWGRLGLDGLPRPIHIEHGRHVIQWDRTTDWVEKNLAWRTETLSDADDFREERTGLHELEFIETRRHTFRSEVMHDTCGSVNVLNLVEGEEAEVFSPDGKFEPFTVHYAETFIVPESVKNYGIRPTAKSEGQTLMTIKAYVRESCPPLR